MQINSDRIFGAITILAVAAPAIWMIFLVSDKSSGYWIFANKPLTQATLGDIVTIAWFLFIGSLIGRK